MVSLLGPRQNACLVFSQLTTLAYGMVFDGSVKWSPAINLSFRVNFILMLNIRWHQWSSKPTGTALYLPWNLHAIFTFIFFGYCIPQCVFPFFWPVVKHAWYYRAPLFETSDCSRGRVLWLWICFSYISWRGLKSAYSANITSSVLFNRSKGTNAVESSPHLILISHPFVIT